MTDQVFLSDFTNMHGFWCKEHAPFCCLKCPRWLSQITMP